MIAACFCGSESDAHAARASTCKSPSPSSTHTCGASAKNRGAIANVVRAAVGGFHDGWAATRTNDEVASAFFVPAIVGLGFGLPLDVVLATARAGFLLTLATIGLALLAGWWLARAQLAAADPNNPAGLRVSAAVVTYFPDPNIVPRLELIAGQASHLIIIDNGSRDTEKWNTQVAKVVNVGALAFKNRNSMEPWPHTRFTWE